MDDLISRKAARTAVYGYEMQTGIAEMPLEFAHNKIDKVSSVPAVPLDKLCEYLNSVIDPCIICKESQGPQCNEKREGCWERVLEKWMEGLDAEVH